MLTTVIFVHGISNMPDPSVLKSLWENAFASDLPRNPGVEIGAYGATVDLVYWSDVLYQSPTKMQTGVESSELSIELFGGSTGLTPNLDAVSKDWIRRMSETLGIDPTEVVNPDAGRLYEDGVSDPVPSEAIPLPWPLKKPLMRAFVRDVHHYLFNVEYSPRQGSSYRVRDEIRERFVEKVQDATKKGPVIILAHSAGTIIAYDCLKNMTDCPPVDNFLTVGSPLGMSEVQDKLDPGYSKENGYPIEKLKGDWHNVYDPVDIVSFADPILSGDFRKDGKREVIDHRQLNGGVWTHGMLKYASGSVLRNVLRNALVAP